MVGGRRRGSRSSGRNGIVVVQVNGLLDPPNAALIEKSLREAASSRVSLIVFQLDGSGSLDVNTASLVQAVHDSPVPVRGVGRTFGWWSPRHGLPLLALAGAYVSVAPGAHIGPINPVDFDHPRARFDKSGGRADRLDAIDAVLDHRLSGKSALAAKVIDGTQPTLLANSSSD